MKFEMHLLLHKPCLPEALTCIVKIVKYIFASMLSKCILFQGHHPEGGAHAKFTNYAFDVDEFLRLVAIGAKHVKHHAAFKEFHATHHDEL